jgi:hypothetical protein
MPADFAPVYAELRALMLAHAQGMKVLRDDPGELSLLAPRAHPRRPKEPMWFGMVRQGKAYVSVHLLPLYMKPAMQARVTPAFKKRMQGKACFNFKAADPAVFAELAVLTEAAAAAFAEPMRL